jgi:hypothetical protein
MEKWVGRNFLNERKKTEEYWFKKYFLEENQ